MGERKTLKHREGLELEDGTVEEAIEELQKYVGKNAMICDPTTTYDILDVSWSSEETDEQLERRLFRERSAALRETADRQRQYEKLKEEFEP